MLRCCFRVIVSSPIMRLPRGLPLHQGRYLLHDLAVGFLLFRGEIVGFLLVIHGEQPDMGCLPEIIIMDMEE